ASGSSRLERGLSAAVARTRASLPQIDQLRTGMAQGSHDLADLETPARDATDAVNQAVAALEAMHIGVADPQYRNPLTAALKAQGNLTGKTPTGQQVDPRYPGMTNALGQASAKAGQAAEGVGRLEQGSRTLVAALGRLAAGAQQLRAGAARLQNGARHLVTGIRKLESGGGALTGGL